NGPVSLITQLGSSIQGKFAYCLGPTLSRTKSRSKLTFGEDAVVSGVGTVSTPLFLDKVFYFLNLEAFSVGNKRVEFGISSSSGGGSGNIIIDSGTTLSLLPKTVYSELESTVAAVIKLEPVKSPLPPLNLCYKAPSGENLEVPVIIAHFSGTDIKWNALNTFVQVTEDAICFSFAPTNQRVSIFGNLAHQNFLVGYDIQKKTLSFKPTDCTK
ncbi:PREDICTED: aspartic proteinase CDR1-like, partial [Lupinus angustifolius]|uniref:aspartic proteinase CDR1-like n=1 Tax=Lupinus angustifolius TaxID=3871 RepID=UPI00092E5C6E